MRLDPLIEQLVDEAVQERMYGSLEFKFECGKLVLARKSETLKPTTTYRDNREGGTNLV